MPELPEYQQRVGAPNAVVTVPAGRQAANIAAGTGAVADALQRRGQTLAQQYDTISAMKALNSFRTQAREKLHELEQRKGSSAYGIQQDYDEWYQGAFNDISEEFLKNDTQHRMFNQAIQPRRDQDLDRLAGHEARQISADRVETVNGQGVSAIADIRLAIPEGLASPAPDLDSKMARVDERISEQIIAMRMASGGMDTTVDEQAFKQIARMAQMEEIIDRDPESAEKYLEHYRGDLGDKYHDVKAQLKSAIKVKTLDAADAALNVKYGSNHEAKIDFLNDPNTRKKHGIDFEMAGTLIARYRAQVQERERREADAESDYNRMVKYNDIDLVGRIIAGESSAEEIEELIKGRKISPETAKWATNELQNPASDDPGTLFDLYEKLARGEDITDDLLSATHDGALRTETFRTMAKNYVDQKYKRGAAYLVSALKPGPADQWTPGLHKRFADAQLNYNILIEGGMDPIAAAKNVVNRVVAAIPLTYDSVPRPKYLVGQKNNRAGLEAAKEAATVAYNNQAISAEEYAQELGYINDLIKVLDDEEHMKAVEGGTQLYEETKGQPPPRPKRTGSPGRFPASEF
jgi:hypothetical protein